MKNIRWIETYITSPLLELWNAFAELIAVIWFWFLEKMEPLTDFVGMNIRYGKYWYIHRKGVNMAGRVLGVSRWRLFKHDASKLLPDEWFPNARYWGMPKSKRKQADYDYLESTVWAKHYARNDHHTAYWLGEPIPEAAMRELIADWWGAGYVHGGKPDVKEWYRKRGHKIKFTPENRLMAEDLISDLDYVQRYLPHLLYGRGTYGSSRKTSSSNNK